LSISAKQQTCFFIYYNQKKRISKLKELQKELKESGEKKNNKTDPDAAFIKNINGIKTSFRLSDRHSSYHVNWGNPVFFRLSALFFSLKWPFEHPKHTF